MFSSLQLVKIWTYIYIIAVTCMTHLPCQCFLTPFERKQHSIDKIDLPSSEGPTDHEVKHERTRLGTRRLNGIEIVAQFQQEESIMRSKSSRLSRMTKPNWVFASLNNPVAEVKDVGIPRVSGYKTKQLYCLRKLMCGS